MSAEDESAWIAAFLACQLGPVRPACERENIRAEYRDRGPAEIVYRYDAAGFTLKLGPSEYTISVARVAGVCRGAA